MIDVVCTQKRRPQISQRWTDKSNPAISSYCVLMSECWSEKPANRHTALKIKITLDNLLKTMQEERSKMQSRESAECSNDSGVRGLALPTNS
ncbi:hypothetical protein L596_005187 [Steinernema carpocapsae]|uniref:Serine-threonine/tyrosine-protein kinase catalytic domain-containing protein n=1 Tax=Steinernema carpocapsae TaxID=34508 RepID=A0A4U8V1U2_STECR|nr:hypothetical protein L596_005187 [Steinernema carpocapsae]